MSMKAFMLLFSEPLLKRLCQATPGSTLLLTAAPSPNWPLCRVRRCGSCLARRCL